MNQDVIQIRSIRELLEQINLSEDQKHDHVHILRFDEDSEKLPNEIHIGSESYFEVTIARKSNTSIVIDQTKIESEHDMITFLSPGQTINVNRSNERDDKEGFIIFFTVDFLDFSPTIYNLIQRFPYFNMHFSPVYYLDEAQSQLYFDLMEKMYQKFKEPGEDNFKIIQAFLTILLFEAKQLPDELIRASHSRSEEITFRFENLLKGKEKWTMVKDYANQLHVSPIYLSECVKSTTGKSAKKVIIEYKMREAISLLQFSEKTVDEIASIVGFEERSNFINFFKKNKGMAPNKYRKELRKNIV